MLFKMDYKIIFIVFYFISKLSLETVESVPQHERFEDEFGLCRTKLYYKVKKLRENKMDAYAWIKEPSVII